jgi:hypothetical protein
LPLADEILRPHTEKETLRHVRNSLIKKSGSGMYSLRIVGHSKTIYSDYQRAVERLEEVLGLRPFTLDV